MTRRTATLPQQRAQETRQRLLDAGRNVFARQGFGQGTVDEIAAVAGVSMGALYHHFSGKEELFRALLGQHVEDARLELSVLQGATSLRDAVGRFVDFWSAHLRDDDEFGDLLLEFFAQASREPWAQEAIAGFFRQAYELLAEGLRLAQSAGFVRPDLDPHAAALLVFGLMEGISCVQAIDPAAIDLATLRDPWVDLIVRFIEGEGEPDIRLLQERFAALLPPREPASSGG